MLRVLCIDPHPVVCAGLTALARRHPDFEFVGSATGAEEAAGALVRRRPDLILVDHDLVDSDGLAVCRRLKSTLPGVRVVLYTTRASREGLALAARVAGADGLLDKATPAPELFAALRSVGAGEQLLPRVDPAALEAAAQRVEPADLALLAMLADRTSPADVAETLHLDGRGLGRRINRMLRRLDRGLPLPA